MPRTHAPLAAFGTAALAALLLAACGGEDAKLLPGETAREINANLDTVKQLASEDDCVGAESAVQQVGEQIEALQNVDRKLKQALEGGASRLREVIAECEEEPEEAISPATVPSELEEEEEPKEKEHEEKREKEPKEAEPPPKEPASPSPPPQAKGEGKGLEGNGPSGSEEEGEVAPSGGVGPGTPAGSGESGSEGGG